MGCYRYGDAIVCRAEVERREKITDFECPCCGSLWAQVTFYEMESMRSPTIECWYCGRQWSDGERLGYRAPKTLAMKAIESRQEDA
jgi:predicted RNA-binding Zn-ribbon protein involved in translation (DUF1610 family)